MLSYNYEDHMSSMWPKVTFTKLNEYYRKSYDPTSHHFLVKEDKIACAYKSRKTFKCHASTTY